MAPGGALLIWGILVRLSPDSAFVKNTMASVIASQKIPRTAFDLFMLLLLLLGARVPDFFIEPQLTLRDPMSQGRLRRSFRERQAKFLDKALQGPLTFTKNGNRIVTCARKRKNYGRAHEHLQQRRPIARE
jgi:hypothetical protein